MDDSAKVVLLLLIVGLVIVLAIFGPIFTIWALNTLFHLGIPYTFQTWMAVLWLTLIIRGFSMSAKSSD